MQRRKRSADELDDTDRELLDEIQNDFPLDARPYRVLGQRFGLSEDKVIERMARLKGTIIRQVSAIFDTRRLGYQSSLVAFAFPEDGVDAGAHIINRHPGVSHNYRRNHRLNLWFTVAVSPDADLDRTIEVLAEQSQPDDWVKLQTLRMYKIGVELDMTGKRSITERKKVHNAGDDWNVKLDFSPDERATIVELQKDLPAVRRPFLPLAEALGISEDQLFERARNLQERGAMRRYAAILRHRNVGYAFNAMGVWEVPDGAPVDELGYQMASFRSVSHCYRRPVYPQWPYSLFSMVHATTKKECQEAVKEISESTGITDYMMLYSTREYKKTRVRYFV